MADATFTIEEVDQNNFGTVTVRYTHPTNPDVINNIEIPIGEDGEFVSTAELLDHIASRYPY